MDEIFLSKDGISFSLACAQAFLFGDDPSLLENPVSPSSAIGHCWTAALSLIPCFIIVIEG